MAKKIKKWKFRLVILLIISVLFLNFIAYNHAYQFTHYSTQNTFKTQTFDEMSFVDILDVLFFGVKNPRPENQQIPDKSFEKYVLQNHQKKKIEIWQMSVPNATKTVLIFHGYGGEKSRMLPVAETFLEMKMNTILVDFLGAGSSEGNEVTIGYHEAQDVKTVFKFANQNTDNQIVLFGTSMGATAIMRAISEFQIKPHAVILECPFGSLLNTVKNRFQTQHLPPYILPELLVFWGGFQCDFSGFNHNPIDYASKINCPVLLMHGAKDKKVSMSSIDLIYNNLQGQKTLKIFPNLQHQSYLRAKPDEWTKGVSSFLENY